jgi:ketosteroid isomerase-like protein
MGASGAAEGLLAALAEDAVVLADGREPLRGRAAARGHLEGALEARARVRLTTARADVSAAGDLGYTIGWSAAEPPPRGREGAGGSGDGHYIAVWRKRAGRWSLAVWLGNASKSPAPAPAPIDAPSYPSPAVRLGREAARREILDADSAFARRSVERGAGDAFAAYAHDDVALLGGGLALGREAVAARYAKFAGRSTLSWAPVEADAAESGDLGYSIGHSVAKRRGEGGAVETYYGKYLSVWRKADAGWRFVTDGGNERPAPAGAAP